MPVLRPLFGTSWAIGDWLSTEGYFSASTVLITSASSKTSYALAWELRRRREEEQANVGGSAASVAHTGSPRVVGLTSARNRSFVESTGVYDAVLVYDDAVASSSLPASEPAVLVDMAGNTSFRAELHNHYKANLVHSCSVGQ